MPTNWKKEAETKPHNQLRSKKLKTIFRGTHLYSFGFLFSVLVLFGVGIFVVVEENNISFSLNEGDIEPQPTVRVVEVSPTPTPAPTSTTPDKSHYSPTISENFTTILSHKIYDLTYAYVEVISDGDTQNTFGILSDDMSSFTSYSDGNSVRSSILTGLFSSNTVDFWFDEELNKMFLVNILNENSFNPQYGIFQVDLNDIDSNDTEVSWSMIYSDMPSTYTSINFQSLDIDRQTFVMKTETGDGCTGGGNIWTLDLDGNINEVSATGMSCAEVTKPRFAGLINSQLLFVEVTEENAPPADGTPTYLIKRMYTVDPWSLEETTLIELDTTIDQLIFYDKSLLTQVDTVTLAKTEIPFKEITPDSEGMYHYQAYDIETNTFRDLNYTTDY